MRCNERPAWPAAMDQFAEPGMLRVLRIQWLLRRLPTDCVYGTCNLQFTYVMLLSQHGSHRRYKGVHHHHLASPTINFNRIP